MPLARAFASERLLSARCKACGYVGEKSRSTCLCATTPDKGLFQSTSHLFFVQFESNARVEPGLQQLNSRPRRVQSGETLVHVKGKAQIGSCLHVPIRLASRVAGHDSRVCEACCDNACNNRAKMPIFESSS